MSNEQKTQSEDTLKNKPAGMRVFYTVWLGQLVSVMGSGLTSFGLAVWILDQTGAAMPFALTVFFGNIPVILLSPVAGMAVDRWNRRWIMILADVGSAVMTVMALLLLLYGRLEIWHIFIIAAVGSAFSAFQEPAYTAAVTQIVPQKQLGKANGLIQIGPALQMLVTPLAAGLLFVVIGLEGLIAIDLITFLVAVGSLFLVKIPQPEPAANAPEEDEDTPFIQKAMFGWRYLRDRPGLFGLLVFFAGVNFFLNFSAVLMPKLVLSIGDASTFGIIQTVFGVGMLIGSIGMGAWGGPSNKYRVPFLISLISVAALGLVIAGLRPSPFMIGAGFFILTVCVPFGSGTSQALFQSKVEPIYQGRVFATRNMVSRSLMPVAFLLAGFLADSVFEPALMSNGWLADSLIGSIIGTGPGRGTGALISIGGVVLWLYSLTMFMNKSVMRLEKDIPDIPQPNAEADEEQNRSEDELLPAAA